MKYRLFNDTFVPYFHLLDGVKLTMAYLCDVYPMRNVVDILCRWRKMSSVVLIFKSGSYYL